MIGRGALVRLADWGREERRRRDVSPLEGVAWSGERWGGKRCRSGSASCIGLRDFLRPNTVEETFWVPSARYAAMVSPLFSFIIVFRES